MTHETERAWIEISPAALRYNLELLRAYSPTQHQIIAIVKANAYGHGAVIIAQQLAKAGIHFFAVATLDEAIELRQNNIYGEILILGPTTPSRISEIIEHNCIQTISGYQYGMQLATSDSAVRCHIKIDTGMHRLGEPYQNFEAIASLYREPALHIEGIFTHFAVADSLLVPDITFTQKQILHFQAVIKYLKKQGINPGFQHTQSTYGLFHYPQLEYDFVRIGLGIYGLLYTEADYQKLPLQPVLTLKSRVIATKELQPGDHVGYGCLFKAERTMPIAVLAIGYADGIPRNLFATGSYMLINGKKAPIISNASMDYLVVDTSGIEAIQLDTIATVIGKDGKEQITLEQFARRLGHEQLDIATKFHCRLPRIIVE
ncbi:alanine racemase [Culicoidibacter larvae]|uniref:Alanine racemase n=1 Tax=Culicoidibacter larvae TaxID=2579976 RepID=A0A5R8QEL5_9FIRM|nr:alanine racemase [Culicoidibacter larvae]TLG75416.1 alanine racemase [Culicoidibacter larvae]